MGQFRYMVRATEAALNEDSEEEARGLDSTAKRSQVYSLSPHVTGPPCRYILSPLA